MPTDRPSPWWRRTASAIVSRWRRPPSAADAAQADDRDIVLSLSPSRIPTPRQLRYLPRLLSTTERRWIRFFATLGVLSALVLIGHRLSLRLQLLPTSGGALTEAIVGTPQFLNPVLAASFTADDDLTHLLFRGLLRLDEGLRPVPDLAQSVEMSADGKTYTVSLRPNLRWSDGEPLTAEDVVYTVETISDPEYQSPYQSWFANVNVAAPNPRTVVFTLAEPYEPFHAALTIGILPSHLWQDQTPQTFSLAELNIKPVNSGPFSFHSLTKDRSGSIKSYTFTRNKWYEEPAAYLERVNIKFYPDQFSALDALKSDAVDSFGGIDPANIGKVPKDATTTTFGLSQMTSIFFNQKTKAALKVRDVRQALAFATDKESIVHDVPGNQARVANSPLFPHQPGYNADVRRYPFDLAQANDVLEKAGWKKNDQGVRQKGANSLSFTLTTADDPTFVKIAEKLQADWQAIGAKVELKTVAANRIQKDVIRARQYDVLLFGQIGDLDGDPYPLWHSSQQRESGFGLAIFYLKPADQDLDIQRTTTDPQKHDAALRDFQNIMADEVPAIMLYQTVYPYAHQRSLRGLRGESIVVPSGRFGSLAQWYVRTRWSLK